MSQNKSINVREVLQQNSYTTSVDELKHRGKKRVRVINAEQISALIEEAVNRIIATSAGMGRDDVKKLVERSREEFRRLLSEREKELNENRERVRELDVTREELAKATAETERLKIVEGELRRLTENHSKQISDLQIALNKAQSGNADAAELDKLREKEREARQEMEELKQEIKETRKAESEIRKADSEARKEMESLRKKLENLEEENKKLSSKKTEGSKEDKKALEKLEKDFAELQKRYEVLQKTESELRGEIKGLSEKKAEVAPAAVTPEMAELLRGLATEVASVKAGLNEVAERSAKAKEEASEKSSQAVADRMEEISKSLSQRLEQIGKKVGISSAIEAEIVGMENIFSDESEIESNLENIEVKERKGAGVSSAIEKMKALKKGKKKG